MGNGGSRVRFARIILILILMGAVLTACAVGPNPEAGTAPEGENLAGFWLGSLGTGSSHLAPSSSRFLPTT